MLLRRSACAGLFAFGALTAIMLDPQYTSGQPGGGSFGKGGGGFGKGGFGQPPGGGGFGQPPAGGFGQPPTGGFGKGGGFGQPPAAGGGFGQPPAGGGQPGGGGSFGGGGDRAERTFGFLSQGKDTIDFSRMDPNMKIFARSAFERAGMPAPSDNTVVTKAQFVEGYNRAQAAKGITPGGSPQPVGGASATMTFGGGDRGRGFGGPPGGGPGFGGPGYGGNNNWQGGNATMAYGGPGMNNNGGSFEREKMSAPTTFRMTDQDIERRFQESDVNKDGKLSFDELSDRSPLKSSFQESDTNKDSYIDMIEYKAYIAARFGGDSSDPNAGSYGSYAGNGNYGRENRDPRGDRKEEQPVIAIRYGKLPAGLPSWWDSLDSDKDGQIGLYEWRQDGRDMKEFQKMDLDHDGVLAPQEWQRYNVMSAEQAKAIAAEEEIGSGGGTKSGGSGRPSFGSGSSGGWPPSGGSSKSGGWPPSSGGGKDKGSDKGSEKDPKNPFRNGGGKK